MENCNTKKYEAKIVAIYPHSKQSFTQGLQYETGVLYESTGLYGQSTIQRYKLDDTDSKFIKKLEGKHFAEGLVIVGDKLIQLTYKAGIGYIYEKNSLKNIGKFRYKGEGWGLTYDGEKLIMSDGSDDLRYLDNITFKQKSSLKVKICGRSLKNINELEYIDGLIYANIWQSNRIVTISPESGEVISEIDISKIAKQYNHDPSVDVLNGIAWDAENSRLFITGKFWPHIYHIELEQTDNK